jgi:hypothetical protein
LMPFSRHYFTPLRFFISSIFSSIIDYFAIFDYFQVFAAFAAIDFHYCFSL